MIPMMALFLMEREKCLRENPGSDSEPDPIDLEFLVSCVWILAALALGVAFGIVWAAFF